MVCSTSLRIGWIRGFFNLYLYLKSARGKLVHSADTRRLFFNNKKKSCVLEKKAPVLRLLLLIGKNFLGVCLIAGGLLMLVLPGQGLITIITGLLLIDYPGKFQLEQKIVSMPSVLRTLNWIRIKAKKPLLKRNSHI